MHSVSLVVGWLGLILLLGSVALWFAAMHHKREDAPDSLGLIKLPFWRARPFLTVRGYAYYVCSGVLLYTFLALAAAFLVMRL